MPKFTHLTTNFTAGELSPEVHGRVDMAPYQNGAAILENVYVGIRGGAIGRPGLRFSAAAKFPDKAARLIPFVFSREDAYVIEMGDEYMRFYRSTGRIGAPYEITTLVDEAMLFSTEFVQGSDTMFLTHEAMPTQRLRRFTDTFWQIDDLPFDPMPFSEIGHSFTATLTLSAATVGTGRTVTASSGVFLQADVGREILYLGGTLKITGYTSTSVVTGDITSPFTGVAIPADVWTLAGSPRETMTPSAKDPAGATITLTATALTSWRASDVGKHVRINSGLVQITAFTTNLVVQAKIISTLAAVVGAPADSWTLEAGIFSATNGYPAACALHQQRLVLGGSSAYPKTLWGSETGVYNGFTLGTFDTDAYAYSLDGDQVSKIKHITATKVVFALTDSTEFTVRGGIEKPVTPTNVRVDPETFYGSNDVRPVRIGKDIVFVQAAGHKIRSIGYDASEEDFDAIDITVLSEHVTGDGIVDMTYKQEPDSLLLAPRADGQMVCGTIQKKQEVAAFTRWVSSGCDGVIESTTTIPTASGNQTWCLVRRTVNGATVRNVEVFDDDVNTDCAITYSGAATNTFAVPHLPNTEVEVIADGAYMGEFTVTAGNVVLPRTALTAQIGLLYTNTVRLLTPETQGGEGSIQGNAMSTSEVVLSFLDTYSARVNGKEVPFRNLGSDLLDEPPPAFTGVKRASKLGWARGESLLEITNDKPFPFHLRFVARIFTTNQG